MNLKRRNQRTAPFLEKNWIAGVNALTKPAMGAALSTPKHVLPPSANDDDVPPQKRPRLSPEDLVGMDQLIAAPEESEDRPTLRIDVVKLMHKDSKKFRPLQAPIVQEDLSTTKATCRITVFDVSGRNPRVLHCQSKICNIKTYKNPSGPKRVARIDMPRPFFIPKDNILINKFEDDSHDFSESYKLVVELEAFGNESWPPLGPQDLGIPEGNQSSLFVNRAKRHLIMKSEFESVFGRNKNPLRVSANYGPDESSCLTDYSMDVDLRWTSGLRPLGGNKPSITAFDPEGENYTTSRLAPVNGELVPGAESINGIDAGADVSLDASVDASIDASANASVDSGLGGTNGVNGVITTNGVNGVENLNGVVPDDSLQELDEDLDGEHTPTRALRTRGKSKVYNLKVLSDQAQGIERKRRARAGHAVAIEGRVVYCLPTDQPVSLDFFRCISCGAYHETMSHLQLHLQTHHPNYDYVLETTCQGPQFRVTRRVDPIASPARTYQLSKAVKPFNLESFVAGDQSWISSRLGPDNSEEPVRSPVPKPVTARQLFDKSSSRPSPSTDAVNARPKKKRATVPHSKHQFFDPVSKANLKAGDEVPKPVIDNSWLIQKHRENIREFSDVTPEEKDYVWKWDAFILEQNITSTTFFSRAWLEFIEQNASWLVAEPHRMIEFSKHLSALLARDVLDDQVINKAMLIIDTARAQYKTKNDQRGKDGDGKQAASLSATEASQRQSPRASHIIRGANGCTICQLPVLGPSQLICSNRACTKRLYHIDCIRDTATTPVTQVRWTCNKCSKNENEGSS